MKTLTAVLGLLGAGLLAGCAGPGSRGFAAPVVTAGRHECPAHVPVCKITIKVLDCAAGRYEIDFDPMVILDRPRKIQWRLEPAGYHFLRDGIVVDGSGFTPDPGNAPHGPVYTLDDDWTDRDRDIKYWAFIAQRGTGGPGSSRPCKPLDPVIRNQ